MADRIPMTRAGYDKIKAELNELENEKMPEIEKRIGAARSEGDLSENAEYHGARESQGLLQAKINLLKSKLASAEIVDPATMPKAKINLLAGKLAHAQIMDTTKVPKDQVSFGCTVVVKDLDFGDTEEFTLVGAGEEDYDVGKILVTSPLAQGLLGKKKGEKAEVQVPAGVNRFEIVDIRFE
jgi:transcription elongation factor GreA